MAKQIVMDVTGDTRHEFDPTDARAVAEAFARFQTLTSEGFTAAVRTVPPPVVGLTPADTRSGPAWT